MGRHARDGVVDAKVGEGEAAREKHRAFGAINTASNICTIRNLIAVYAKISNQKNRLQIFISRNF